MDSAKNNKKIYIIIIIKTNYIKVTPHKSIYIYIYVKKEIKSKMCNRIKKSAKR